jgi:DNA-binding NarL/FixJ family response regulator
MVSGVSERSLFGSLGGFANVALCYTLAPVSVERRATDTISLLIAEDDALLRGFLNQILTNQEEFRVLGSVGRGGEVVSAVERLRPDVLLLDVNMPELTGLQVLPRLAETSKPPLTLMLSGDEDEDTQLEAARAGARGFLCKSQAMKILPDAIRKVAGGEVWFSGRIIGIVMNDYPGYVRKAREQDKPVNQLSEREREVLVLVGRGLTNKQIADDLFMSVSTVKVHLRNIFSKLDLPNRTEAAVFASREGLLDD